MDQEEKQVSDWEVLGIVIGAVLVLAIAGLILFRMFCVNFVDNYELGYKYTLFGAGKGKIEVLKEQGYIIIAPFIVKVHKVDLRPMQVCINANQRVLNCKLVQFNPKGLELFLSWHGRGDYSGEENLKEILKSYAYDGSGRSYPFLTIIRELKPEESLAFPVESQT